MTTETSIYEYAKQGLALSENKTAIWFYGKSITYRELFEKIDNVADNLYALGVREGTVVTIHLPNCPQAVMAIYAVAKLGGICNMVHALMPRDGLKENMAFTESDFLVTYKSDCAAKTTVLVDISRHMGIKYKIGYRLKNGKVKGEGISFDELEKKAETKGVFPEQSSLAEKCSVYLNSSGTTGKPKTVMLSHSAFNNCSCDTNDLFEFGEMADQISLGVLPLFHGYGFTIDMHRNIPCGSTLVMMTRWDVKLAIKLIKKLRITVLVGVPTMYSSLLGEKSFSGNKIRHLEKCCIGGDILSQNMINDFNGRVGKDVMLPGYGLTETTTVICVNTFCHNKNGTIGYPLRNSEVAVINDVGNIAKSGKGELIISGKSLMIGYLKDSEATESAFLSFRNRKWVRSGDCVEIDLEGYVHFISRIKDVIVHNGYNVYPKEIEAIILSLESVVDACVFGNEDKNGTQTVCAAVVTSIKKIDDLKEEIINSCSKSLPKYAIPKRIIIIDELPKNNMGKVDRIKLKSMI